MSKQSAFTEKKNKIVQQLSTPAQDYSDLSPKGSVDVEIRALVDAINAQPSLVTTSSCAGRVSVFLEGARSSSHTEPNPQPSTEYGEQPVKSTPASDGGKGGGGRWLFVSHSPLDASEGPWLAKFGMVPTRTIPGAEDRLVHFKFEPMILHIMAENLPVAQMVLTAAHQAGFRESGVVNVAPGSVRSSPIVAVRSMGLAFASVIGVLALAGDSDAECVSCLVDETYLGMLVERANERFRANTLRIQRFQELLSSAFTLQRTEWEDSATRRERKRREGLLRQATAQSEGMEDAGKGENEIEGFFDMPV